MIFSWFLNSYHNPRTNHYHPPSPNHPGGMRWRSGQLRLPGCPAVWHHIGDRARSGRPLVPHHPLHGGGALQWGRCAGSLLPQRPAELLCHPKHQPTHQQGQSCHQGAAPLGRQVQPCALGGWKPSSRFHIWGEDLLTLCYQIHQGIEDLHHHASQIWQLPVQIPRMRGCALHDILGSKLTYFVSYITTVFESQNENRLRRDLIFGHQKVTQLLNHCIFLTYVYFLIPEMTTPATTMVTSPGTTPTPEPCSDNLDDYEPVQVFRINWDINFPIDKDEGFRPQNPPMDENNPYDGSRVSVIFLPAAEVTSFTVTARYGNQAEITLAFRVKENESSPAVPVRNVDGSLIFRVPSGERVPSPLSFRFIFELDVFIIHPDNKSEFFFVFNGCEHIREYRFCCGIVLTREPTNICAHLLQSCSFYQ